MSRPSGERQSFDIFFTAPEFMDGTMDIEEAVQTGNLVASLYIKSSLAERYAMPAFERIRDVVRGKQSYAGLDKLEAALI